MIDPLPACHGAMCDAGLAPRNSAKWTVSGSRVAKWPSVAATSDADAWREFIASLPPELAALHENPPEDVFDFDNGRSVTVAELFKVLSEQVAVPPGLVRRSTREDRAGPALLAGAWRHATFRQARAVLALRAASLLAEAQVNARACFEHAVMLRRLALAADDGQLETLIEEIAYRAQQRGVKQLDYLEELDDANGAPHGGLLQAARARLEADRVPPDKSRPQTRTVKAVFDSVPHGRHLYDVYSRLSEHTHASLNSAAPYLNLRTDSVALAEPQPVAWAETAALLCWSCWAAEDAMVRFLYDGADLAGRQAALLARVGLAPD